MPSPKLEQISVRAQTWIGAYLIRQFCLSSGIIDSRISIFCEYLEELAQSTNVPAWDEKGGKLEVSGLDVFPEDICHKELLTELIRAVHEISACQIYGAWQPEQGAALLRKAAKITDFGIERAGFLHVFAEHDPEIHGWGSPVTSELLRKWKNAT